MIYVIGAGLSGSCAALALGNAGQEVTLIERAARPMLGASRHNEGKLHFGYVYAADISRQTHPTLIKGSLQFLDLIEQVTGQSRALQALSNPFTYVVPHDTQVPVTDLRDHMACVDADLANLCADMGLAAPVPCQELKTSEREALYSDQVTHAFRSPEFAVETWRLGDIIAAAIFAHPRIKFLCDTTVAQVATWQSGYKLTLEHGDETQQVIADHVINAAWEDRLRLDAMVGQASPLRWAQRWKATVTLHNLPCSVPRFPSTIGFVGPYGDYVTYDNNVAYLSWYPALRLSMSHTATRAEVEAEVANADLEALRLNCIEGLSSLMPGLRTYSNYPTLTKVHGGFIMAVGDSDIDDPNSTLHARHEIGVAGTDRWLSISTGKYCTAPMFGVQAAHMMLERIGAKT